MNWFSWHKRLAQQPEQVLTWWIISLVLLPVSSPMGTSPDPVVSSVSTAATANMYTKAERPLFCGTENCLHIFHIKGNFHLLFLAQPY